MAEKNENDDRPRQARPAQRRYKFAFGLSRQKQRALMSVIAILVTVTFIIGFHDLFRIGEGSDSSGPVMGKLFGQPVTQGEFNRVLRDAGLYIQFEYRVDPATPGFAKFQRREAWRRLAAIRYAKKLGLSATLDEAQNAIVGGFVNRDNGEFDRERYVQFVTEGLSRRGVTLEEFRRYMQDTLLVAKLERIVAAAAWLPPFDVSREMARRTDSFLVDCVDIPAARLDQPVKATEDDARAFLEANPKAFTEPDRIRVKYVAFPFSNYVSVAAALPETRAREYYLQNSNKFFVVTN